MNNYRSASGVSDRRPGRRLSRAVLLALGTLGLGLLMVGLVLAANNTPSFPVTAEQIDLGQGYSGTYTDTRAADGIYRVLEETYVTGTARTLADNPNDFPYRGTPTDVIVFIPYTMPAEGGYIYRIAPYIFQTGTTQLRAALYAETDGVPRLLLAQSQVLTVSQVLTQPGWLWFDIPPQRIPGNTRYWLAYQANNSQALLGWRLTSAAQDYRQRSWSWGAFPSLAGVTWASGTNRRSCSQIAYTATQYALDAAYTVPVTPSLDAYTLTVRGGTSGEPFSVTADGTAVGSIVYSPTAHTAFSDDMESGSGGWTAHDFSLIVTDSAHYNSPTHTWWTDDVPYGHTATLTSAPITIPFSTRDMELRFWMRMVSELGWDGGWLEYRIQDGNGNWSSWLEISPTDIIQGHYNAYLTHLSSGYHWGWSGEYSSLIGTVRVQMPISATGRLVQWRWVFECDPVGGEASTTPNGWWIDDVRVVGTASEDTLLVSPLPVSLANDGQIVVRFQDTLTNSYPDRLGLDLIAVDGILYNRAPVVTVTLPNGGEYFSGVRTVSWNGLDVNGDVVTYNVYLSLDNGAHWSSSLYQVAYAETGTPAAHSWTGFNTAVFSDSDQCRIRVTAADDAVTSSDLSDAVFIIDNTPPTASLTAPNGGELLRGGDTFTITWSASDAHFGTTPIALHYSTDGGATYPYTITAGTANDGSYAWTVPGVESTTVRVRLTATDDVGHVTTDASEADFAIDNTAPVVVLTAPNGGELLRGGSTFTITWNATDAHFGAQPIALSYSLDGGTTYTDIVTATVNTGGYAWTVPEVETDTVRVRVTATDLVGHSVSDESGDFGIDAITPTVELTAPVGGELLRGGAVFTITWSASDNHFVATPIALHYSTDGGATYPYTIAVATGNDGSHPWTLPTIDSNQVRVRVTATDQVGHSAEDSSGTFTIDSTPPNGTIAIAEGAYTRVRQVHLLPAAPDDTVQMYLDGDLQDASNVRQWVAYTPTVTVTLAGDDGSKTVRVQYRDVADNVGEWAEASITYDATPPVISDRSPADGSTLTTGTPVISATVHDETAGVDPTAITMTVDGALVDFVYNGNTVSWLPDPPLANTPHTVTLLLQDRAGNPISTTWGFTVNEPPLTVTLVANPPALVANGTSTATITATVRSLSGHPVADGTEVVFTTTLGTLMGGSVYTTTTQAGLAVAVLTAPTTDGVAQVTARAGAAESMVEVLFFRYRTCLPLVMRMARP